MNTKNNNDEKGDNAQQELMAQPDEMVAEEQAAVSEACDEEPRRDDVQIVLERMGVSESVANTAKVIIQSLKDGNASSESVVKLVVQALRHDEDLKNAETQGYLRGRNEVIEAATNAADEKSPKPVNFPIYSKRSFWD